MVHTMDIESPDPLGVDQLVWFVGEQEERIVGRTVNGSPGKKLFIIQCTYISINANRKACIFGL